VEAVLQAPLLPDDPGFCLARLERVQRAAELEFHIAAAHPDAERPGPPLTQAALGKILPPELGRIEARQSLAGFLTGSIDLVFTWNGRWYILDWKSNHLGNTAADYDSAALEAEMSGANYHLQYLLYTVALGRHLRTVLADGYDYQRDFGGVMYVFLRGVDGSRDSGGHLHGVFFRRPDPALIQALEALLS
jgi:exodeoxyribonuclease V beta subunit